MKKIIAVMLAAILCIGCFSACSSQEASKKEDTDKIQIVTTIFPEYDWVMNILGENPADAEVTLILDSGVDLHSFQPTVEDILTISKCDLFIYVGGESDDWVSDVLQEAFNQDMVVVNLLEVLGDVVKEEEIIEGMQAEEHGHEENEHEEAEHEEEHEHEEAEYDEHVWLSLRNAVVLTEKISELIQTLDQEHADVYDANAKAYIEKLKNLDQDYAKAVSDASVSTLLFGDRFPFRYLVDDYGLSYYAAFVGCSAETEASFETVTFLAQKVDELSLHTVMTIEGTDHRIAETIIQNTRSKDQQILTMDSMQSTTAKDIAAGMTYLSIMEKNLTVLKNALQ